MSTVRELLPSFSYSICLVHLYVETPQLRMASSLEEPARSNVLEPAPFCETSGGADTTQVHVDYLDIIY